MDTSTQLSVTFSTTLLGNSTAVDNSSTSCIIQRYSSMQEFFYTFQPAREYAEKYIPPAWFLVGFPGNILAFIVWIQPRMRPSSGIYLTSLALSDFIFLILQLIFQLQNTYNINVLFYPVLCELFPIVFLTSQYLNPLLVLGFTVERYIAICHPFKRDRYCSTSRAIRVVISLTILLLCLHAIQGYFWHYSDGQCSVRESVYIAGASSLWSVWTWVTELLVFGLVPLAILVLNICVIREARRIKQSEKRRLCLLKGQKLQKRQSGASATTFMLLAVSFYMIFTTLPVTMLYVLSPVFKTGDYCLTDTQIVEDPVWNRHITFGTVRIIIERLCISHYACNFYIYLLTGHVFRKELQSMCIKNCCRGMSGKIRNTELDDLLSTYKKPESQSGQNGSIAHL